MKLEEFLHMSGGAGHTSYAANCTIQEKAILNVRPLLEEAVGELHNNLVDNTMVVADLGCASGPNTFTMLSEVISIISKQCERLRLQPPEMQLFLNDLPGNDFNNLFQLLDYFKDKIYAKGGPVSVPHFVVGLPGSFYGRLFPCDSVHLFHSAYSLHWMSGVPKGLDSKQGNVALNKGNIYIGRTSPSLVVKLYQQQFQKDFSQFLKLRFNELVLGGQMVLAFLGRKNKDICGGELSCLYGLLSDALNSMVIEGLVEEEKMDSFNLPFYAPSMEEVKAILKAEELFDIIRIRMFETNWDPYDNSDRGFGYDNIQRGQNLAMCIRAIHEPIIASHFGATIVNELFSRFGINVAKYFALEQPKFPVLNLSLRKKHT